MPAVRNGSARCAIQTYSDFRSEMEDFRGRGRQSQGFDRRVGHPSDARLTGLCLLAQGKGGKHRDHGGGAEVTENERPPTPRLRRAGPPIGVVGEMILIGW